MTRDHAPQAQTPEIDPRRLPPVQAAQAPRLVPTPARQAVRPPAQSLGRRSVAALLLCGSLAACATTREPPIRIVETKVEVAKPCVPPDVPPPPARYADENAAELTPEDRYLAVAQANQERKARLARVEPIIAGCR